MVLVGADNPPDHVPIAGRVEGGDARPEAGDLDEHLRAIEGQELDVVGRLVVQPDVVCDRGVDVSLETGVVRDPAAGARVEVDRRGQLGAVRAALPRVRGPVVSGLPGDPAGRVEPPVAIAEQGPGEVGEAQVEEREDEQRVPEDVSAVCLAGESARRDPGVDVGGVLGDVPQQVEDVQAQLGRGELLPVLQLERAQIPELVPAQHVLGEQLVEAGQTDHLLGEPPAPGSETAGSRDV